MKSLRLNKEIREDILNNFMAKWGDANKEPTYTMTKKQLANDLAHKIWDKVYGKYDLSGVPDDMLSKNTFMTVQYPKGSVEYIYFGRDSEGDSIYKPTTQDSKVEYVIQHDDDFYLEFLKHKELLASESNTIQEYHNKRDKFKQEVKTVLDGVNTTKQLIEVWKEAEDFLPASIQNPSNINLPSVNIETLNNQL